MADAAICVDREVLLDKIMRANPPLLFKIELRGLLAGMLAHIEEPDARFNIWLKLCRLRQNSQFKHKGIADFYIRARAVSGRNERLKLKLDQAGEEFRTQLFYFRLNVKVQRANKRRKEIIPLRV